MLNLSKQEKIVFLVIMSVLLLTFGWKVYQREKDTITIMPSAAEMENIVQKEQKDVEDKICIIHISGAVHQPGVYQLTEGKRMIDAVKIAGGELEKANLDAVNLAAHLYDGQKIIIPFIPEEGNGMLTRSSQFYEVPPEQTHFSGSSLLNLNAVTSRELASLPGIGTVLAERILEYRKTNGVFRNIEEVMNVPGIGEKKFQGIKEFITVY